MQAPVPKDRSGISFLNLTGGRRGNNNSDTASRVVGVGYKRPISCPDRGGEAHGGQEKKVRKKGFNPADNRPGTTKSTRRPRPTVPKGDLKNQSARLARVPRRRPSPH